MRLGLLQLNNTIGDFAGNCAKLLRSYRQAIDQGATLVLAPELYLCGYPPRDLLLRPDFIRQGLDALEQLAREIGPVPLLVGYVEINSTRPGRPLRNAVAVLQDGAIRHRTFKMLLPTYDVFDEDRYFEPATEVIPLDLAGRRVAVTICEDIWNDADYIVERRYARDPVRELVAAGADLILNLSASPWERGKERRRLAMLQQVARDERVPLAQVNLVGGQDELIFDGHSVVLDARGQVIAQGRGFSEDLLVVTVPESPIVNQEIVLPVRAHPEEQLFRALALGVRDYVQKCGFRSVVLGLSGGIDSAVVAAIAVEALGAEKVWGVALPSRHSSSGSREDAAHLAKNLGIRFETLPIAGPVQALEAALAAVFLDQALDVTEENIQSRVRGALLMALSNKYGPLVLTTGNKSELAVGYCTLYGDMCGALAVISDVLKTEVYALARWINREHELIPRATIEKPPSAELRPGQIDQDSLPPYEVLDRILTAYLVHEAEPARLEKEGIPAEIVRDVLD